MKAVVTIIAIVAFSASAFAGTISGKVSGVNGESVVYVDAIAGKTFPAPSAHPVMDQKGLLFQPHLLVVQAGTTVDFVNSDKVAHNAFWPMFQQGAKKSQAEHSQGVDHRVLNRQGLIPDRR